ncbi:MAG: DUF1549 domain-containing protein, partial [Verrucomicrobiota bacterium]
MIYNLMAIVRNCILAILFTSASAVVYARVYTDLEGKTIEADLISIYDDIVEIRRHSDQKLYSLKLSEFSLKDQKFIKSERASGRLTMHGYSPKEASIKVANVSKDTLHFDASRQIDLILESYWKEQGVRPAPIIDDATYLRRAYLKIIGRIPTHAEAVHFLEDSSPYKRTHLVDKLLDSSGYVSHTFNLWADVLRVRTTGRDGGYHGGVYYAPWLKEQIRNNLPYDEFVQSLLTAEGYPWENPAVAYYLRDFGMPLDNMSMTAQIFLGTQLQCAQCHNHPTDVWTQKDFYELSAYTYGLRTGINLKTEVPELKALMKYLEKINKDEETESKSRRDPVSRTTGDLFQPLRFGVIHSKRQLRLPKDYQYEDAAPKALVQPAVLFGQTNKTELHDSTERVDSYTDWMISKNNQRFTKVISNRMWKHAMGKGLIEPVDNLTDSSVADVPELLEFLEELMRDLDYDLKQYLRILYNTRYFQREAVIDNPDLDDDYHLEGPVFERMSAEQIWDSLATLMNPDIDDLHREVYKSRSGRAQYSNKYQPAAMTLLENLSRKELADHILEAVDAFKLVEERRNTFSEMQSNPEFADTDELKKARRAYDDARKTYQKLIDPEPGSLQMASMTGMTSSMAEKPQKGEEKWLRGIRRASELNSPEYNGHLLQIFGQSDRELIENSENGSNVIQALFLMNSNQTNKIMVERSTPVMEAR